MPKSRDELQEAFNHESVADSGLNDLLSPEQRESLLHDHSENGTNQVLQATRERIAAGTDQEAYQYGGFDPTHQVRQMYDKYMGNASSSLGRQGPQVDFDHTGPDAQAYQAGRANQLAAFGLTHQTALGQGPTASAAQERLAQMQTADQTRYGVAAQQQQMAAAAAAANPNNSIGAQGAALKAGGQATANMLGQEGAQLRAARLGALQTQGNEINQARAQELSQLGQLGGQDYSNVQREVDRARQQADLSTAQRERNLQMQQYYTGRGMDTNQVNSAYSKRAEAITKQSQNDALDMRAGISKFNQAAQQKKEENDAAGVSSAVSTAGMLAMGI